MERIALAWGRGEWLDLKLPPEWQVVTQSDVRPPDPIEDLSSAIHHGFEQPIGCSPLQEMIDPETTIALVMDDPGRPTPVRRLAPLVLDLLVEAGARPDNVSGLFAIGAHRTMDEDAMEERAGGAVTSRIRCYSFDCREKDAFVPLGRTERGTPVHLNRLAVDADLRVLVGTIEPHPQAGFGGGFKNLLPGLAGAATIGHNHLLMPSPERYNMIGTLPHENPMRLDLEEAGRMIGGPTFIVNVVLDLQLDPVAVVCGEAVAAHRVGVSISRRIYGIRMDHQVDVVLSSAYPMGQTLRQAGKGVLNVAGACRPGGVIVGFMRCEDGLGDVPLPRLPLPLSLARSMVKGLGSRGIASLVKRIPGPAPEDRFMINFGLQMLKDYHVLIFSPCLKRAYQDRFPPVLYDDRGELFEAVGRLAGGRAPEVAIFQQGGVSFPVVAQSQG